MISLRLSTPDDADALFIIWRDAVLASHDFLATEDFHAIAKMVAEDYLPQAPLWVAVDQQDRPLGFMGMTADNIDSLFIAPQYFGQGIGQQFIQHAKRLALPLTVDVNEQNQAAFVFYQKQGFVLDKRSETDDQGRPYPLLHLRLSR